MRLEPKSLKWNGHTPTQNSNYWSNNLLRKWDPFVCGPPWNLKDKLELGLLKRMPTEFIRKLS